MFNQISWLCKHFKLAVIYYITTPYMVYVMIVTTLCSLYEHSNLVVLYYITTPYMVYVSYPWIQPSPTPTSDYLSQPQITWTTWITLGPLTSVPSQTTQSTPDPPTSVPPLITWISQTIQSLRLSMTLYRLPHLDSLAYPHMYILGSPLEIQYLRHSDP